MRRTWALMFAVAMVGCGDDAASDGASDSADSADSADDSNDAVIDAPPGTTPDSGGGMVDASPGVGEPSELAGITLAHNEVRAAVQTATPLMALEWDPALAATAAAWVAQCQNTDNFTAIMDHNDGRSQGHPYYVGENIYASSGTATAQGAVTLWAGEKVHYNPATGACTGGICGHYTQVVWRTTRKVGCARGNCPSIQFPNTIVCNYGPGGNSGGPAY